MKVMLCEAGFATPDSAMVCAPPVPFTALSARITLPLMVPVACGAKSMPNTQLTAGFNAWLEELHEACVPPSAKFADVLIELIVSAVLPKFITFAYCAALTAL